MVGTPKPNSCKQIVSFPRLYNITNFREHLLIIGKMLFSIETFCCEFKIWSLHNLWIFSNRMGSIFRRSSWCFEFSVNLLARAPWTRYKSILLIFQKLWPNFCKKCVAFHKLIETWKVVHWNLSKGWKVLPKTFQREWYLIFLLFLKNMIFLKLDVILPLLCSEPARFMLRQTSASNLVAHLIAHIVRILFPLLISWFEVKFIDLL